MNWLVLLALTAGPLDEAAPLRKGEARPPLSVTANSELKGSECTFVKQTLGDPRVTWQWVARCRAEDVRVQSDGAQVGVRLFTQQSHWTLLVLDGARAVGVQEAPDPKVSWVSRSLLTKMKLQYENLATFLALDERDGSTARFEHDRGYFRVRPRRPEDRPSDHDDPTRSPLFEKSPPPETPVRAVWFDQSKREPWVLSVEDPWHRGDFSLRAPGGDTRNIFSLPAREQGGSYRIEDLTHVTSPAGEVFSSMVDGRHLVLWPKSDGTFLPRVAGVSYAGQTPPLAAASSPPCEDQTQTRSEERVSAPRLFMRGKVAWAAWLSSVTTTRWHLGPVLKLGAKETRTCEWILDGREDHTTVVVGKFTADGQLEEQLRLPAAGVPYRLQVDESADGVTLAVAANTAVTVTRLKL